MYGFRNTFGMGGRHRLRASSGLRRAAAAATALAMMIVFTAFGAVPAVAVEQGTVTVAPGDMHGWAFWDDTEDGFGGPGVLVTGPATPPLGTGSVSLPAATGSDRPVILTGAFNGTPLADITALSYATYRSAPTAGVLAISLQFNIDYHLNAASHPWQGRLVYEPYQSGLTVSSGIWQTWSPLDGMWWASGGVGMSVCPQSTPCTWEQILTMFPNAGIHPTVGAVILKAGGEWTGFVGSADALTIGVKGVDVTYDFEATPANLQQ